MSDLPKFTLRRLTRDLGNPIYDGRYKYGIHAKPTYEAGAAFLLHSMEYGREHIEFIPGGDKFTSDGNPAFIRSVMVYSRQCAAFTFDELVAQETGSTQMADILARPALDLIVAKHWLDEHKRALLIECVATQLETPPE
jgi:hypothetical protein